MSKTEDINRATMQRWYDEVWGQCNPVPMPDIAAPKYLRHDATGANNLITSQQYRDMVKPLMDVESVTDFSYFLVSEGDYVGALGRFIMTKGRQWDWVQLFRLEDGANCETWLPGMGGTDPLGFPNAETIYTGSEIPSEQANAGTANKQAVQQWYEGLIAKNAGQASLQMADTVQVHDFDGADRPIASADYSQAMIEKLGGSVSDLQLFMIEENNYLFAVGSWKIDGARQWDWVQAFQLENDRIVRTWLPAINTSDSAIKNHPENAWTLESMPAQSRRIVN